MTNLAIVILLLMTCFTALAQ